MDEEVAHERVDIPLDKLARVYRKMQSRIQELTQAYENEVEAIRAKQDEVKTAIKDQMLALGTLSARTEAGTIVLAKKTRYHAQDWDALKEFIKEHDALDLLQKRISETNMRAFLEDNPGVVPAGLNTYSEYALSITKNRK